MAIVKLKGKGLETSAPGYSVLDSIHVWRAVESKKESCNRIARHSLNYYSDMGRRIQAGHM